jgi:putative MATE family efflux protein
MNNSTVKIGIEKEKLFVDAAFRRFLMPAFLSNLGLALGGMVDCLVVGSKLGLNGLSAISLGIPVYMFYNLLSYGFSIGGSIHYANLMGNGKHKEANALFGNLLRFLLIVYAVSVTLGLVFLPQLLQLLGADPAYPAVYDAAMRYVRAQLICVPVLFCQGPLYYFVNSDGASKRAAIALVTSNIVDIVLNYVFVIQLNMGAEGSVWSTVIGAAFCLAICGSYIVRRRGTLRFSWAPFSVSELWQSIRTGFSSAVQYVYQFFTVLLCNKLLFSLGGPVGISVFDVVFNLSLFTVAVSDGIGMTIQPMISTYLAERNKPAIHRTLMLSVKWGGLLGAVVMLLLFFASKPLCALFGLVGDASVSGSIALRIYSAAVLLTIFNQCAVYYGQTVARERQAFFAQSLRLFILFLPFAFLFSQFGLNAFWWTFFASELGTVFFYLISNLLKKKANLKPENSTQTAAAHIFSDYIDAADSLGKTVESLQNTCESWGCLPQQAYYATLVVEEICAAILQDAQNNQHDDVLIKLTVVADEDGFTLHLRDNSYEFNPFEAEKDDDEDGLALGMALVKKKAKEFFYRRYQGFNTLVVIL